MKSSLLAVSALAFASFYASSASAVPGSGIKAVGVDRNVIQVDGRCYWRHGYRHCWGDGDDQAVAIDWGFRHRHHDRDFDGDRRERGGEHRDHDGDRDRGGDRDNDRR